MLAILKRELKAYFYSPMAYILIGVFILLASASFRFVIYTGIVDFSSFFLNLRVALFVILPILTMRILAEDRKTGTEKLLLTSPVSLTGLILGKYLAAFFVYLIMVVTTFVYQVIVVAYSGHVSAQTVGAYVGLILFGASVIAIGVLASSLTESQVIAGVVSFVSVMLMWAIGSAGTYVGGIAGKALKWISIIARFDNFTRGIFDVSTVVYYLSFIFIMLFITVRVYERRRWTKG